MEETQRLGQVKKADHICLLTAISRPPWFPLPAAICHDHCNAHTPFAMCVRSCSSELCLSSALPRSILHILSRLSCWFPQSLILFFLADCQLAWDSSLLFPLALWSPHLTTFRPSEPRKIYQKTLNFHLAFMLICHNRLGVKSDLLRLYISFLRHPNPNQIHY